MLLSSVLHNDWEMLLSSVLQNENGRLLFVNPLVVDDLQPGVATEGEPVAEDDEGDVQDVVEDLPPYVVEDDHVATVEKLGE